MHGELPTAAELAAFTSRVATARGVTGCDGAVPRAELYLKAGAELYERIDYAAYEYRDRAYFGK